MLVGVMSDTHGRFLAARKAIELFDRLAVGHVIHCGDVGDLEVFDELVGRPLTFVWGNTDVPYDGIDAYLRSVNIAQPGPVPALVELDGKRFAVFHGHEPQFRNCAGLDVDYILYGHTHEARDKIVGTKRFINPGALHRARPKTVATINTDTDEVKFHEISGI